MIALGITVTWLALTAAGFAALSALGRIELDDGLVESEPKPERGSWTSHEPHEPALTDAWPPMPGGSPL